MSPLTLPLCWANKNSAPELRTPVPLEPMGSVLEPCTLGVDQGHHICIKGSRTNVSRIMVCRYGSCL